MNDRSALLLTGVPGIGKTTVVKRLAARLSGLPIAGFYTEEIRAGRQRVGFSLMGLCGPSGVIAHVDFDSPHRVGRYKVDVAAIDRLAAANLTTEDVQIYLIDEIGRMECLSHVFVDRVRQILGTGRPVITTIARRGGGFIGEVKNRPECELWEVTRENRNRLVEEALTWLKKRGIRP